MIRSRTPYLCVCILAAVVIAMLSSCSDKSSDGDPCWASVDTIFQSGHTISGTGDIPSALVEYEVYVDTTTGVYYDGSTEIVLHKSEYVFVFKGRKYWLLYTSNYDDLTNVWHERETLHIDENGVFVKPLGCY